MASSSLLRFNIHRNVFVVGSFKCIRSSSSSSSFSKSGNICFNRRMSTSGSVNLKSSSFLKKSSSPWLMLPPDASELKFYSLAENRVVNVSVEKEISDLLPNLDFKGSSHGWLALFNPYNLDLFLYNPISRRRVNLPPVRTPNILEENLKGGVVKVVLSCSPDDPEQDCRAMMYDNTTHSLAFCSPGKSKKWWTRLGNTRYWDSKRCKMYDKSYDDFVYSDARQVFFCLTHKQELETWDLRDESSPKMTMTPFYGLENESDKDYDFYSETKPTCVTESHLVLVESEVLLVDQNVMGRQMPAVGCYVEYDPSKKYPHKTIDFEVYKYDPDKWGFKKMDGSSLDGLALFTGFYSHSMALSTSEFPELKPNSIYFTDPYATPSKAVDDDEPFRGHDIGIFNYRDETISPCYYPSDIRSFRKIVPSPMWFFPSPI